LKLREAKDAAEAANQSKDRFLAVLSHELRTPLTPVLMVAGALEHDPDLRADVREDIVMIKRNVELEIKLIDDLLDLSRITSGKVALKAESVDLNEAVRQVCGICQPQLAEHRVNLKVELDQDVCMISADPARLQQVLWNVLKNAIKFTPAEGIVSVKTARLDPERCEVRVQDSGIGIPADILPRIFNAFEQGDTHITKQFGGLGLGLAISRALVELHGGAIRAESEGQGRGATFIVELPGKAAAHTVEAPGADAADDRNAKRIRVLLVEDHADTARALARFLRAAGMVVVAAGDVTSAIAAAERESFDLVVSDLGLPDGDGYEIMRAIRARRVIPGIAMSGYGMDEDIRRSREAGFTEHLVKPIGLPQLISAIRRVTETRE
jgi:CheY-like chemotaxis protein/two-component sensor histidine kinase